MKYFTFKEFERSATAEAKKIDNSIPEEIKPRIQELVETLLDPLREAWGSPIKVNSGYRSAALNKAVGGSSTSAHSIGYGVDLWPVNKDIFGFVKFVKEFLKDKAFDQMIDEYDGAKHWCHIGLKNGKGQLRKQFMVYKDKKYTIVK